MQEEISFQSCEYHKWQGKIQVHSSGNYHASSSRVKKVSILGTSGMVRVKLLGRQPD